MKLITNPEVYIVGRQHLDPTELYRFFENEEISWLPEETCADAEIIPEIAGRLCFDDQTDVLTKTGWKSFKDLREGEAVATLSPITRKLEYQIPLSIHCYSYEGNLLEVNKRDVNFSVTPEHRQFIGRKKGKKTPVVEYSFEKTINLIDKRFTILTSANGWEGTFPDKVIMPGIPYSQKMSNHTGEDYGVRESITPEKIISGQEDIESLALLCAHYVANGSILSENKGIVIYGKWFEEVSSLAKNLGLTCSFYVDKRNNCKRTIISGGQTVANWFRDTCGDIYHNKILPNWILNLPIETLRKIWDILVKTDGHRYVSGREIFSTGSSAMRDISQEILTKIGNSSYTTLEVEDPPCWRISKKLGRPAQIVPGDIQEVAYSGKVYCVTTQNGIVYVRRKGKVHFSGNCYMSFNKPRPGGNEKYLHHIIEVGHGSVLEATVFSFILTGISRSLCYSPDTEVFTEDGWKNITLLKQEDIILTKNPVSGLARWSSILKMNELDYTGSLLGWSTSQMSSPLMTPDHLLWAAKYDLRRARGLSAEQNIREYGSKIAFSEIFGKRFHIDAGIQQDGEEYTTVDIGGNTYDAEYLFSWLGWMATDGCLSKSRPNKVNIDQSKKENIPIISSLMSKLFKDNWHVNGPYSTENMRFHTSVGGIAEFVREHLGPNKKERKFSKWLLNASNRLLKIFLDSAIAGDGCIHKTNGHTVLYCPSNVAAGQYQYILARLGTPGNIRVDNRIGESHILYGKECVRNIEMYNIEIDRRGPGKLIKAEHQYSVPYVGKVYCPTTEDGLIFVRGSGQPFWCGNSHELIRHRAGVAISQLSQRYVDESVAEYVVPPEYVLAVQTYNSGNTSDSLLYNMGEEWLSALQNAHKAYCRMVDLTTKRLQAEGLQSGTDLRKHARQAARSLLPNATETKIFWTANVRTLRHFLEQRGNISADKEIQNLALKLLQVCKKEAPNLFKDYEITEKGIDTQFRKV